MVFTSAPFAVPHLGSYCGGEKNNQRWSQLQHKSLKMRGNERRCSKMRQGHVRTCCRVLLATKVRRQGKRAAGAALCGYIVLRCSYWTGWKMRTCQWSAVGVMTTM